MQLEDPTVISHGAGTDLFIDTTLIHGTPQRVRVDQIRPQLEPLLHQSQEAVLHLVKKQHVCEGEIKRLALDHMHRIVRGRLARVRVAQVRYRLLVESAAVAI